MQTPPATHYHSIKFQLNPCIQSIGFPIPNCFSRAFPIFFIEDRGSVASAFFPVFFPWTARANGEREKAAIQYPDPSCHLLQLHKVSAQSVHFFYRLPLP